MELLTGKHIPRRTFLRDAAGAVISLPLLDAMLPTSLVTRGRGAQSPTRLVCIEMVHGAAGSNELGAGRHLWAPAAAGREFDLSPSSLKPLERFRDYLTIISNTDVRPAEAVTPQEIGGDHFRSSATFLTQAHPKQTEGSDVYVGTSLDQLYVQRFGQDTPIPSMQLCIENVDQAGGCAYGYACVYTDTISWASPTEPLPMIRDPRAAFEQLFGAGGTPEQRAARRRLDRSILDWFMDEVSGLKRQVGPLDRQRLDQYLDNIREVERRIQRIETHNTSGEPRAMPEAPAGVPDSFAEHVKLMFDLQVLAFLSDTTRVFSFKLGRDGSGRVYPESGVGSAFHPASHHGGQEKRVLEFARINEYHVSMVPYFLEKLKTTMEGEQNLLDKTLLIYGSPMGDSNLHNHKRCPLFLVGRANGQLKGGEHIKAPDGTAMANVMLTLLHKLGRNDMTSFGDSTGDFSFTA
ncbi:MAG TPA: DUF1552 domain-containing protein [Gemmatimonadales bacterium]|jgi:hypothetical protein|nr:DUF1552 domain-containing protein [Gemmatimonadales bacterium]